MENDMMREEQVQDEIKDMEIKTPEVVYNSEKDFYKGMSGEMRFKAEGLFKKAKEKGISIEKINIDTLKESQVDFPGIGIVDLPAYMVKVRGRDIQNGQVIMDGKQIDYYNRYQKYIVEKIESKNIVRDERGRPLRQYGKPVVKDNMELFLSESEMFDIGRSLISDKEFGMEKTITGACDRVIRKLMGENDWLYPDEMKLLDEEFDTVQKAISEDKERRRDEYAAPKRRATERQINYLKAKIKNWGMDPENERVIKEVLRQGGFGTTNISDLSTSGMSKIIEGINDVLPKVKEELSRQGDSGKKADKSDLN